MNQRWPPRSSCGDYIERCCDQFRSDPEVVHSYSREPRDTTTAGIGKDWPTMSPASLRATQQNSRESIVASAKDIDHDHNEEVDHQEIWSNQEHEEEG